MLDLFHGRSLQQQKFHGLVFFDNNIVSDEQEKMAHGQLCKLSYWVQNEPVVTLNIFTNFYFDTDFGRLCLAVCRLVILLYTSDQITLSDLLQLFLYGQSTKTY